MVRIARVTALVLLACSVAWAQSHTVITTDQSFTSATGHPLTGTYECTTGSFVNCFGGGGTITGSGTPGALPVWSTSSVLADYAGTTCPGQAITSLDASGAASCIAASGTPGGSSGNLQTNDGASGFGAYLGASCASALTALSASGSATCLSASADAIPFFSATATLATSTNFTFDHTNFRLRGQNMTTAADNSANMLQFSGTLPASPSGANQGMLIAITSAGSSGHASTAFAVGMLAGATGSGSTAGFTASDAAAGTGADLNLGNTTATSGISGNSGIEGFGISVGAGYTVGLVGVAGGSSTRDVGIFGRATSVTAGTHYGVLGNAGNSTQATDNKNVAGAFTLHTSLPTGSNTSVALIADGAGNDIFRGYSSNVLKYTVDTSGNVNLASGAAYSINSTSVLNGTTLGAGVTASSLTSVGTLTSLVVAGTLTDTNTGSIGWSVVAGANTACNTTCTNACVVGQDTGTGGIFVGCADATADVCVCSGSS